MPGIRIVVVDDHEVVRHGLRQSLELEPDMVVIGEARTGEEAVQVAQETQPDVMLLDVRLADTDGPEVCRRVLATSPQTAVVMLTNYLQDGLVFRSLIAGAKGYVIKDVELAELKKMIRAVYRGDAVLDPKVTNKVISTATGRGRLPSAKEGVAKQGAWLSETDIAIIRCLSEGMTNKEIGLRIHLSPHTVKDHLEKIGAVLGVRVRTKIVAEALRRGLI
ncbi:MAG: response regulator transcription factor [Deltaproteobacteria bacterium]|nr:response regulator transcription factor [Deltaproteobacteria bacterium]MBI3078637.1 response regulator transcription factor [Deltaproteobacteria bacterium]